MDRATAMIIATIIRIRRRFISREGSPCRRRVPVSSGDSASSRYPPISFMAFTWSGQNRFPRLLPGQNRSVSICKVVWPWAHRRRSGCCISLVSAILSICATHADRNQSPERSFPLSVIRRLIWMFRLLRANTMPPGLAVPCGSQCLITGTSDGNCRNSATGEKMPVSRGRDRREPPSPKMAFEVRRGVVLPSPRQERADGHYVDDTKIEPFSRRGEGMG